MQNGNGRKVSSPYGEHWRTLANTSLFSRFILTEVISESDGMLSFDLEDPGVWKDFNSIFIGAMTKQYAKIPKGHN